MAQTAKQKAAAAEKARLAALEKQKAQAAAKVEGYKAAKFEADKAEAKNTRLAAEAARVAADPDATWATTLVGSTGLTQAQLDAATGAATTAAQISAMPGFTSVVNPVTKKVETKDPSGNTLGSDNGGITQSPDKPAELDPDFDGTITALTAMLSKYDMVGIVEQIKRIRKKFPQIKSDDIITMIQFDSEYNKPYLARFAGNAELMSKGKKTLTMGEYLSNEQAYEKVFKAYDVKNLSNRGSYAKLIAGEVSPEEAGDRVNLGYTRVLGDKDTLESFKKYYPQLSTGDIIGAMLDPETQLPMLQKKVTAAEIGGAAASRAFALSEEQAMELGSSFGVDKAEAQKGFQEIGMMGELGSYLPGEMPVSPDDTSGIVTKDEMLGVTFKKDTKATQKVRKVAGKRVAEFEAGGDFAASQTGISGLGSATRGT